MKQIDAYISQLKSKYEPVLTNRIKELFTSDSLENRGALATELLTQFPFEIMGDFHDYAFAEKQPERDGRARLKEDQKGHIGMSGKAILSFYDPNSPKTPAERFEYFKGISIVFPYMLTGNHHRWVFEGETGAPDYKEFLDAKMPISTAEFEPLLQDAYASGDKALCSAYCRLAGEHPFRLLQEYYLWLFS